MKTYNWPPALPHMCGQTGFIHKTNIYHLIKSSALLGCLTDRQTICSKSSSQTSQAERLSAQHKNTKHMWGQKHSNNKQSRVPLVTRLPSTTEPSASVPRQRTL